MSTIVVHPEIVEFAAAVRSQLDDLPADDADELTDGLIADLSDQAAEAVDEFSLPDAAGYASELRAAAGLPPRRDPARPTPALRRYVRATNAALARWGVTRIAEVRRSRLGAWLIDTAVALRPVWWLARAFVMFLALVPILVPVLGISVNRRGDLLDHLLLLRDPAAWVLLGASLLLSVQWGRGKWVPVLWLRVVRDIVSVLAAIVAPFMLTAAILTISSIVNSADVTSIDSSPPGLAIDGERIRNIFAYDVDGQPIEHVQLFDQDGRPLTTVGQAGQGETSDYYFFGGGGPAPVAEQEIGRQPVWNIFPLRELSPEAWRKPDLDTTEATTPRFPFPQVPALRSVSGNGQNAESDSTDTATPAPSEDPVP